MTSLAVVVPLKSFSVAKDRLRRAGEVDVTLLARALARGVLQSCVPRHVIVVSESDEVSDFAVAHGVEVLQSKVKGLNAAVQRAYDLIGDRFDQLMIVHGDLSNPEGLGAYTPPAGITIITDHHQVGTNVLVVPTGTDFQFSYGPDSRARHMLEAQRLGVQWQLVRDSPWGFDVDEPADLRHVQRNTKGDPKVPFGT